MLTEFTDAILDALIRARASGISPEIVKIYRVALDNLAGHLVTPKGINTYLNSLTCGNPRHNDERRIKTLSRWLCHTDQIISSPIEKVLPP